ncbi:uncharacterized protein PHACADRAFT_211907 [Phanerochaete carnosa HHB-10118-sp]|uniref:Histone-lysine N-methyltransferase, H3 lysine-36 specific n=1 Tax=Phanerochaete carnosa (strain HHB-10118-sp) TaxID=650164 RepID=K5W0Q8_PHACS|nr:uncharacterized protein PHACADRAFT_211907 [Phanerochaete carnosa HHB-10118-sp]EKM52685.1 hypothetical protein PHACADRAFT_211907 [Phanerochaete carnosa HHB-10118-sp]
MPEPTRSSPEGVPAALLFEDNSVVVEEVTREVKNGDGLIKDGEVDSALRDKYSPSPSSSPDELSLPPGGGDSRRTSTTPPGGSKSKSKPAKKEPQLIGDLPRAEEAALKTFIEIPDNHYQYQSLGRSREAGESMTCDCVYEHGVSDPSDACGHDSDCINRLTQVECLPEDCRCRSHCQNQRFQRKQHAPIEIVQTEKKGFGLRAGQDLRKDTFIYEYVGDVVNHPSLLKRMRQYGEEGIQHFYFMALQKDEFIDATKRGGIGRFANHSCNPNCYVAKWSVGKRVRMGIFANRNIKKNEELTFNYNVDRYGHEPQMCYCGEDKCVGFIGGKTQTELAAMDDLYLDALGITDEVEMLGLKGNKKKKSKKLDEDFIPDLKPIAVKDVPKVIQAMRQTQSRKVLVKLLTRIKITADQPALRELMRLRGFSVMNNIMEDYASDVEVRALAMECMITWPLLQRNKVEDSKISVPVEACSQSDNQVLADLAKKLLEQWATLEYGYRIPKRAGDEQMDPQNDDSHFAFYNSSEEYQGLKRTRWSESPEPVINKSTIPLAPCTLRKSRETPEWEKENRIRHLMTQQRERWQAEEAEKKDKVAEMLKAAAAAAEAAASAPPPPKEDESTKKSPPKPKHTKEEKEVLKEKRLMKLVGSVVVKCLSKYQKQMDHDAFKEHAKHLTQKIADKEKKSTSYKDNRLEALSDEKAEKIKKFCKEYIATKILRRRESGSSHRHHHTSSSRLDTPNKSSRHTPSQSTGPADVDVDMSFERPWDDAPSDDEDASEQQPSPEESSSSKRSASDTTVSDPRVRFRQDLNGLKHQGSSDPPSPLDDPGSLTSMSVVSVGRISR